jgi:hypothetical protein
MERASTPAFSPIICHEAYWPFDPPQAVTVEHAENMHAKVTVSMRTPTRAGQRPFVRFFIIFTSSR